MVVGCCALLLFAPLRSWWKNMPVDVEAVLREIVARSIAALALVRSVSLSPPCPTSPSLTLPPAPVVSLRLHVFFDVSPSFGIRFVEPRT